ncbi:MAG: hypothetical protein OXD46_02170 [Chloroflexi bacterium]|nr:hypothetical protein [Chloroflexota bacterium]
MADGATLCDRVDEAISQGEVWRAKEILRGNVRIRGYDFDLYERYGRLLLDIGETSEAGKYLFLSGRRLPQYEEAVAVYLGRHVPNPEHMYFSFPRAARLNDIDEYPEEVRRTLESIDFPVGIDGRLYALRRWREHGEKIRAKEPAQPQPTRVFIPTVSFRWRTVWPVLPRGTAHYRAKLTLVRYPGPLEILITVLINLVLLICLSVGVWVVAKWLIGSVF